MPFEKKDDDKKSRVLSARLSPDDPLKPHEKEALRVWDDRIAEGFKPRQILTDALLVASGHTPEMFDDVRLEQDTLAKLNSKLDVLDSLEGLDERLSQKLESMFLEALRNLKRSNPEALRSFANSSPDDEAMTLGNINVSDAFAENTRRTARPTLKQRQQRSDE